MAKEKVTELIVGNDSGMCKASSAGDEALRGVPSMPGMMVGMDQKDGQSGITHSTTNSGLRLKNIPFCPRAHDADQV